MAMTQVISQFPPAPDSQHDTPTEFNSKADTFVHHQSDTYVTEVNTWKDQANALEGEMNTIKTDIDNTVATIPAGTINDGTTTTTSVWSSTKVDAEIKKLPNIDDASVATDKVWSSSKSQNNSLGGKTIKIANAIGGGYTNANPFPILCMVTILSNTGGEIFTGKVDNVGVARVSNQATTTSDLYLQMTFIVPPGKTYKVEATGSGSTYAWLETRH